MPTNTLGFPFWTRSEWQKTTEPVTGPAPREPHRTAVAHYTANPTGIHGDSINALRAMQHDYLTNRGYSLGYWYYVDRQGNAFQIRGPHPTWAPTAYNAAANPGRLVAGNANDWTAPILFPHGIDEPIPDACIPVAAAIWHWLGITDRPVPHSTLDPTGCCGDAARTQIANGLLDPRPYPTPEPPPIPGEPDDMHQLVMWTHRDQPGTWLVGAGTPVYLTPELAEHYRNAGVRKISETGSAANDCRNAFIFLSGAPF